MITIGKRAGPGTARTTISGSAFIGCHPLSTQDRTANALRHSYAVSISRRAASGNPHTAQSAQADLAKLGGLAESSMLTFKA